LFIISNDIKCYYDKLIQKNLTYMDQIHYHFFGAATSFLTWVALTP